MFSLNLMSPREQQKRGFPKKTTLTVFDIPHFQWNEQKGIGWVPTRLQIWHGTEPLTMKEYDSGLEWSVGEQHATVWNSKKLYFKKGKHHQQLAGARLHRTQRKTMMCVCVCVSKMWAIFVWKERTGIFFDVFSTKMAADGGREKGGMGQ